MELLNLNPLHLEDIANEIHPSIFFESEDYSVLIYRLFEIEKDELNVNSYAYILNQEDRLFQYDRNSKILKLVDSYTDFYKFIDTKVDQCMKAVNYLVDKVDSLEENLYDKKEHIKDWFEYKKKLVRMERILAQAIKAHELFIKANQTIQNDTKLYTYFEDIEEHLNRSYRNCGITLSKLDSIYNMYTTLSNEKMNSIVYILTVISAIFLPLNLLVGFFGMNTEGLYFSGNPNGTLIVTSLLGILFVGFYIYFKFKKHIL